MRISQSLTYTHTQAGDNKRANAHLHTQHMNAYIRFCNSLRVPLCASVCLYVSLRVSMCPMLLTVCLFWSHSVSMLLTVCLYRSHSLNASYSVSQKVTVCHCMSAEW